MVIQGSQMRKMCAWLIGWVLGSCHPGREPAPATIEPAPATRYCRVLLSPVSTNSISQYQALDSIDIDHVTCPFHPGSRAIVIAQSGSISGCDTLNFPGFVSIVAREVSESSARADAESCSTSYVSRSSLASTLSVDQRISIFYLSRSRNDFQSMEANQERAFDTRLRTMLGRSGLPVFAFFSDTQSFCLELSRSDAGLIQRQVSNVEGFSRELQVMVRATDCQTAAEELIARRFPEVERAP